MAEQPSEWAMARAVEVTLAAGNHLDNITLALDKARRQGIARLADPDDHLINRGMSVAAATGAVLTYTQMHDICQALADELDPTND